MSKKDRKRSQPGNPDAQEEAAASQPGAPEQPVSQAAQDPGPAAPAQPATGVPEYSRRYFVIFWCVIILAAAAAWVLAIYSPNVSESVIERWVMAGLAAGLAAFLFLYK